MIVTPQLNILTECYSTKIAQTATLCTAGQIWWVLDLINKLGTTDHGIQISQGARQTDGLSLLVNPWSRASQTDFRFLGIIAIIGYRALIPTLARWYFRYAITSCQELRTFMFTSSSLCSNDLIDFLQECWKHKSRGNMAKHTCYLTCSQHIWD